MTPSTRDNLPLVSLKLEARHDDMQAPANLHVSSLSQNVLNQAPTQAEFRF